MRVLASVLAVLVTVQLTQSTPSSIKALLGGAYTSYDADGHVVDAANAADRSGRYNKQLIDTIAQLSGRQPQDNVLLTNDYQLLDFQPYHSFQTNKEQYANPLALYPERNAELVRWSRSGSPAEFVADLSSCPFAPPNVFVFAHDAGRQLRVRRQHDELPLRQHRPANHVPPRSLRVAVVHEPRRRSVHGHRPNRFGHLATLGEPDRATGRSAD